MGSKYEEFGEVKTESEDFEGVPHIVNYVFDSVLDGCPDLRLSHCGQAGGGSPIVASLQPQYYFSFVVEYYDG